MGVFFLSWEPHIGSIEQRIHEKEVFDQTCVRDVQKRRIFKRGPGDSGGRLILMSAFKFECVSKADESSNNQEFRFSE